MTAYVSVHDVVVVGAGLFGAAIARECALRGLDVALVEKHEVAHGASSVGKVILGDGLTAFGAPADPAALGALARHLVEEITVRGGGTATVIDVTRLAHLYVLDAVERGATLLLESEVVGSEEVPAEGAPGEDGESPATSGVEGESVAASNAEGGRCEGRGEGPGARGDVRRGVLLADGRILGAGTLVVATGAESLPIAGLSSASTRSLRVMDVAPFVLHEGVVSEDSVAYPAGSSLRVVVPTAGEEAAVSALTRLGLEAMPVLTSEVYAVTVPDEGRRDGARALVHVTESAPGAHLAVAAYLAEAFARSALAEAPVLSGITPLPGGSELPVPPSAALADRWGVSELSLRGLFARHGGRALTVLARTRGAPHERAVLCACEAILECEVRYACRAHGARTLPDVARRTGVGHGACGGLRCAHRAAEVVRAEVGPGAVPARDASRDFVAARFGGRLPFLRAEDLAREEVLLARQVAAGVVPPSAPAPAPAPAPADAEER